MIYKQRFLRSVQSGHPTVKMTVQCTESESWVSTFTMEKQVTNIGQITFENCIQEIHLGEQLVI